MATIAGNLFEREPRPDALSGTPRAHAIDRWIFVFMAAWFIAIVLAGFIPDSIEKVAAVQAGQRPPFPLVLHMHAVVMGSFLLMLLAQTVTDGDGPMRASQTARHRRLRAGAGVGRDRARPRADHLSPGLERRADGAA